jgi:hypothetical protein
MSREGDVLSETKRGKYGKKVNSRCIGGVIDMEVEIASK